MSKVVLSMCVSLDGFIAREDGQEDWLPIDGWNEMLVDAKRFDNIVMGRETYEVVTKLSSECNFDDVEVAHKIIVTRNADFVAPTGYTVVHSPQQAIEHLHAQDVDDVFLLGGGKLNAAFITEGLLDEIWLTINPHMLGRGRPVFGGSELDAPLTFIRTEPMSDGRFRAIYEVARK